MLSRVFEGHECSSWQSAPRDRSCTTRQCLAVISNFVMPDVSYSSVNASARVFELTAVATDERLAPRRASARATSRARPRSRAHRDATKGSGARQRMAPNFSGQIRLDICEYQ